MSQHAEHTLTLKEMLKKYPINAAAVTETFYETVTNQSWGEEEIVSFLNGSKGISNDIDSILEKFIKKEHDMR